MTNLTPPTLDLIHLTNSELRNKGVDLSTILGPQYLEIIQIVAAAYQEVLLKTPAGRNFASENFISEVGNVCFSTSIGRGWFKQELSNQIANTPDVLGWLSTVLKLHIEQGESDTVYHVVDHDLIANGDDVQKLSGFIIKGKLYPSTHIDEYDADKEQCTDCGCYVHCFKKIDGKTLCNKCISMSEDSSIRDQGRGASECGNCSVTKCDNHMYKNIQRVM